MFAKGRISTKSCPGAEIPGYVQGPHSPDAVIFVHGIRDDRTHCWMNSQGQYWPAMAGHDYPDWDVYVYQYQNRISVHDVANLMDLRLSDVLEKHKRVVFVAHSMGGLVVREYLISRIRRGSTSTYCTGRIARA
jgi:pimeloyl-ACP methyl ester carboxylesterase